jgi:hypothetical protein
MGPGVRRVGGRPFHVRSRLAGQVCERIEGQDVYDGRSRLPQMSLMQSSSPIKSAGAAFQLLLPLRSAHLSHSAYGTYVHSVDRVLSA